MELGLPAVFIFIVVVAGLSVAYLLDRSKIRALNRKFKSSYLSADEYMRDTGFGDHSKEATCFRCLSAGQMKDACWDEAIMAKQGGVHGIDPEKHKIKLCGVCDAQLFRIH